MPEVSTDFLLSAFTNDMDWDLVEIYAQQLILEDIYHKCPAIGGFSRILDKDDIGLKFIRDEEEDECFVSEEHIGLEVWMVSDGHHRSFAFRRAYTRTGILVFKWIETELDPNCIVSEEELKNYYNSQL